MTSADHKNPVASGSANIGGSGSGWYVDSPRNVHAPSGAGGAYYNKPSGSASMEHYHPPHRLPQRPPPPHSQSLPFDAHSFEQYGGHSGSFEFSSHDSQYYDHSGSIPKSSGTISSESTLEHIGGPYHPISDHNHRWHIAPSSTGSSSDEAPSKSVMDRFRPPYHPGPNYSPYRPTHALSSPGIYRQRSEGKPLITVEGYFDRSASRHDSYPSKQAGKFIPYSIGMEGDGWGAYGGTYGGNTNKYNSYWGVMDQHQNRRKDSMDFNYFKLGSPHRVRGDPNSYSYGPSLMSSSYPGLSYARHGGFHDSSSREHSDIGRQWTRRPGTDGK